MAAIIKWEWDFGDGSTSLLENPTHIYKMPGYFTVSLTTTDTEGTVVTTVESQYIHALDWGTTASELNATRTSKSYRLGLFGIPLEFKPSIIQPLDPKEVSGLKTSDPSYYKSNLSDTNDEQN